MADNITFDFKNSRVLCDVFEQQVSENFTCLNNRKHQILEAIGCEEIKGVDRISLDFEDNIITWKASEQQGRIHIDLSNQKNKILKAMGYEWADLSAEVDALSDYVNGLIKY